MRRVLLAFTLVSAVAACARPPREPAATVTWRPTPVVAFAPLTFAVRGTGCQPGSEVTVSVFRTSQVSDMVFDAPRQDLAVRADGRGAWSADVSFPVAYPGSWYVEPGCGARSSELEVPAPAAVTVSLSPTSVGEGEAVTLEVRGSGCRGGRLAVWELGPTPEFVAAGQAAVAPDGTWVSRREWVGQPALGSTYELYLHAFCQYEGDVWVTYEQRPILTVVPRRQGG